MKIVWDEDKNKRNKKKHGISFEEAADVFNDPLHLGILDERFDYGEERWVTIGQSKKVMAVVVAHTYMDIEGNETIRVISARRATKKERGQYEDYEI